MSVSRPSLLLLLFAAAAAVRIARGLLPRRFRVALRETAWLPHPALRLRRGRRYVHLRRHAQVRLRAQGDVGRPLQEQGGGGHSFCPVTSPEKMMIIIIIPGIK